MLRKPSTTCAPQDGSGPEAANVSMAAVQWGGRLLRPPGRTRLVHRRPLRGLPTQTSGQGRR
eukprot:5489305-Pyramimonas_sp.AAC.1